MHLLIPFASSPTDAGRHALGLLDLPNLAALLARLTPTVRDEADEYSLSPPHERAIARALGWSGGDGHLPFAAWELQREGVDTADLAWGRLTPLHWQVGREHLTVIPPSELQLAEAESRVLFDAAHVLFEEDGWLMRWQAPGRWYVAHETLTELPTASLDRVVGRNPDAWMPDHPQARWIKRLQNEMQMLWYNHPANDAREARGAFTINSVWLSGCGIGQPARGEPPTIADALREPLWHEDWEDWVRAWRALDDGPLRDSLQAARAGRPVTLTLAGERHAQSWESLPRSWWARLAGGWKHPDPAAVLAAL